MAEKELEDIDVGPAPTKDNSFTENEEDKNNLIMDEEELKKLRKTAPLFYNMVVCPFPYVVILPVVFAILLVMGWTQDDYIEKEVNRIWIPQSGTFADDREYAKSLGKDASTVSTMLAMALSRDGENLFTDERLQEIKERMETTEGITVTYKGITYTWDDLCFSNNIGEGTAYQFACLRLSPMDLFKEAQWYFDEEDRATWYDKLLFDEIAKPVIGRFGIMETYCASCAALIDQRTQENDIFQLFSDIGGMEYNDECKICIEDNYKAVLMQQYDLAIGTFGVMYQVLERQYMSLMAQGASEEDMAPVLDLLQKTGLLASTLTQEDVDDFWYYYVTRNSYASIGLASYFTAYNSETVSDFIDLCYQSQALGIPFTCPPRSINASVGEAHLLQHADNAFSSLSTAGSAFPFWGEGEGDLFSGSKPVSGSGVDMSGNIMDAFTHAMTVNATGGTFDFTSDEWVNIVEKDPIYAWFMAGLTPANPEQVCNNETLPATKTGIPEIDGGTMQFAAGLTFEWCTKYNLPNPNDPGNGGYTKQHFARMWYDLLIASGEFLNAVKGESDPYSWTTGEGCGYDLRGERYSFTNQTESDILSNSSRILYNFDEGVVLGPINRNLFIGGTEQPVDEYNAANPFDRVSVIQNIYIALTPSGIVDRVRNCNRPGGSINITEDDAEEILYQWKIAMEETWNMGWDDSTSGDVQFVSYFDDAGVEGTTARILEEMTSDSGPLMGISIALIAAFSGLFLFSFDLVQSRVLIAITGVSLAVLSYFAAVGFSILVGIKMNITMAWTLPFVIIGIGVDDAYIVLMALKKQRGYDEASFLRAMREVLVPITMTSMVNSAMFGILNLSDIPAVYLLSQVAVTAVIAMYLTVIFCFPAYCYLDMKRQADGQMDILFCCKAKNPAKTEGDDWRNVMLFDNFYKPLVLGAPGVRHFMHTLIWFVAGVLLAVGAYGITQRQVGLGLEDLVPDTHAAHVWAITRTEVLASWPMGMSWGAIDYTSPDVQMKMIKQYEGVVESEYVANLDTDQLWMAKFLIWTTRHCNTNFQLDSNPQECGMDLIYDETATETCSGIWTENTYGLRDKIISDDTGECEPYSGGICRPGSQMREDDLQDINMTLEEASGKSFCPVISGWPDDKWQFCLQEWRNITRSGGNFVLETDPTLSENCEGEYHKDEEIQFPLPFSSGPTLYAIGLNSHDDTMDLLSQTKDICDNDPDIKCWMTGIPYDYWTQYETVFSDLIECSAYSWLIGFAVAFCFLYVKLSMENNYDGGKVLIGSFIGAALIALTIGLSLVSVVGLSCWVASVNLTGFSNIGFTLSVAFVVEYSVHIVSRWLRTDASIVSSSDRVEDTMSFLMLPTFLSFVSSTIGVVCLAFTEFEFNNTYFFRPLIIVMFVTYFFGCWWLPMLLSYLDFDTVKLGKPVQGKEFSKVDSNDLKEPADLDSNDLKEPAYNPDQPTRPVYQRESSEL